MRHCFTHVRRRKGEESCGFLGWYQIHYGKQPDEAVVAAAAGEEGWRFAPFGRPR